MKRTEYQINETGIKEVADFLAENHKQGRNFDRDNLLAWARDAEFQLDLGNPPTIEIKAWESVNGYTQEFRISPDGVDTLEVDDED